MPSWSTSYVDPNGAPMSGARLTSLCLPMTAVLFVD